MRMRKEAESEASLCFNIFVITLRDILSNCRNQYSSKCRVDALKWLDTQDQFPFSFENIMTYLFGEDINEDNLRILIKNLLKDKRINGTRNLVKILSDLPEKT